MGTAAECLALCVDGVSTGVLLRSLAAASHEAKVLKGDDILLRIDGVEVGGKNWIQKSCLAAVLDPLGCGLLRHRLYWAAY